MSNKKYAVITYIFGNYESILRNPPKIMSNDIDYICVTDRNDLESDVWNIIIDKDLDIFDKPYRKLLQVRYNPWKYTDAEYVCLMDGDIEIKDDISCIFQKIQSLNLDIVPIHHGNHNSLRHHDNLMLTYLKRYSNNDYKTINQLYKEYDFDPDKLSGCICAGLMFVQNNDKVKQCFQKILDIIKNKFNDYLRHDEGLLYMMIYKCDLNATLNHCIILNSRYFQIYKHGQIENMKIYDVSRFAKEYYLYGKKVDFLYDEKNDNYKNNMTTMKKRIITIDDFIKHSLLIWTNETQRDFCLKRFDEKFGMRPNVLEGFNQCKSIYYEAFNNGYRNCTLSHAMAIRFALMNEWPFVVIFEQDAWLLDDDIDRLKDFLENKIPDGIELCILGLNMNSRALKNPDVVKKLSDNDIYNYIDCRKADYKTNCFCGSHAYMLFGQEGMENHYNRLRVGGIADDYSFMKSENGIYVYKPLFIQHNCWSGLKSSLHNYDEFDKHKKPDDKEASNFIYVQNNGEFLPDAECIYKNLDHVMLPFSCGGQFANQLMYVFYAYVYSKICGCKVKYHLMRDYDVGRYCLMDWCVNGDPVKQDIDGRKYDMFVTHKEYIRPFIEDTFLRSEPFKNIKNELVEDKILMHVRLGEDYLRRDHFGRYAVNRYERYLENCCIWFKEHYPDLHEIDVLSDNADYFIQHYENIIRKYYDLINYVGSGNLYDDFKNAVKYKYRVMTCSSFVFMCAKIAEAVYNEKNVTLQMDFSLARAEEDVSKFVMTSIY